MINRRFDARGGKLVYSTGKSMFSIRISRKFAPALLGLCVLLLAGYTALQGASWKLVLNNGTVIECDGPPMVVNGTYLYRTTAGKDGSVDAAEVDKAKTEQANHVEAKPQWHRISVPQPSPTDTASPSPTPSPTATPAPSNQSSRGQSQGRGPSWRGNNLPR